jgi:hypothetical protein
MPSGQFGSRYNVTFWFIGSFALTFPQAGNTVDKIKISGLYIGHPH